MTLRKPENEFYCHIEHVMAKINPEAVLTSLGFRFTGRRGRKIIGYCPDHFFFTSRHPSHPKWELDVDTGTTWCYTESRKSNIVFVISRALGISHRESFNILTKGLDSVPSKLKFAIEKFSRQEYPQKAAEAKDPNKNETLISMKEVLEEKTRTKKLFDYFAKSGIKPETLEDFGIVEATRGKYHDRAIIPCYSTSSMLVGFVAVDILGKRERVRQIIKQIKPHFLPGTTYLQFFKLIRYLHERYKKALFCPGMSTGSHLYGLEKVLIRGIPDEIILVEGEKDALKLQQEGFPAVGTHGAHLTDGQRKILRESGIKNVAVAFDGDNAGWLNSSKVVEILQVEGFTAREVKLPEGRDPKDYDKTTFALVLGKRECQQQAGLLTHNATQFGQRLRRHG